MDFEHRIGCSCGFDDKKDGKIVKTQKIMRVRKTFGPSGVEEDTLVKKCLIDIQINGDLVEHP